MRVPHRVSIEEHGAIFESVLNLGECRSIPATASVMRHLRFRKAGGGFLPRPDRKDATILQTLKRRRYSARSITGIMALKCLPAVGEMVYRSALTLKLMTFELTGAIVACRPDLPESIGAD
jgi:hypothetical protein